MLGLHERYVLEYNEIYFFRTLLLSPQRFVAKHRRQLWNNCGSCHCVPLHIQTWNIYFHNFVYSVLAICWGMAVLPQLYLIFLYLCVCVIVQLYCLPIPLGGIVVSVVLSSLLALCHCFRSACCCMLL